MRLQFLHSLDEVSSTEWNALVAGQNPFLSYEFLSALERHGCVGEHTGWLPHHVICYSEDGYLLGAVPLYLKFNSYGEFVFDWHWAEAYRQRGLAYYPKFVGAIPYTPVTSARLLLADGQAHPQKTASTMIDYILKEGRRHQVSSVHWLFPGAAELNAMRSQELLHRLGCQFHWSNRGYRDFQDFLDTLTAKRRKNIKRERRKVDEANLELRTLHGSEISAAQWHAIYKFYCSTFHRLGGIPTLTQSFFEDIAMTMGDRIVLMLALGPQGQEVAAAISFRSETTLYGRHWGCHADYDSLHFEACYYQGLEYCIDHKLQRFEPGAQGEHKIYRGFLPTLTHSMHWIADPDFRRAIAHFLERERSAIREYAQKLQQHSPYRDEVITDVTCVAGSQ
ncbi:MAG: GNAT family N-acetyltransferase [Candidatus Contendobacter odensis]|uniref:GNAT family N-acetyltransferase n=1 Tax=Candidatus Contendibacter odensensis TaxID=1400860 RepID=A0A2G6PE53_9GAMM|nr:MAG: GNAT family N-acetyltransferase [Candidatus Contendobacter odensis]